MRLAERGVAWAQAQMAEHYGNGGGGFPVNSDEALRWLHLAADQKYPHALAMLADQYYKGGNNIPENKVKARELFKEGANLGSGLAQGRLAEMLVHGKGGEKNEQQAVYYATLACQRKERDAGYVAQGRLAELLLRGTGGEKNEQQAAYNASHACQRKERDANYALQMGDFHRYGIGGLPKSPYLAKYYYKEAAEKGFAGAYCPLAETLVGLDEQIYNGGTSFFLPCHRGIPQALFWARRAAKESTVQVESARDLVSKLESHISGFCANCLVELDKLFEKKLLCCSGCRGAMYCGKECQREHWVNGHKFDCVSESKCNICQTNKERMTKMRWRGAEKPQLFTSCGRVYFLA